MDDGYTDDQTAAYDVLGATEDTPDEGFDTTPDSDPWPGVGARRSPRSPAEGVRIIGAEEAAAAIESGQATPRAPDDAPRFGDVPEPPAGPRPPLRFPGADPAAVAKPPVSAPPHAPEGGGRGRWRRGSDAYVEETFWDEPEEGQSGESAARAAPRSGELDPLAVAEADEEYDYEPAAGPPAAGDLGGSFREELERDRYGSQMSNYDEDNESLRPERQHGAIHRERERAFAEEDEAADRFFGTTSGPVASELPYGAGETGSDPGYESEGQWPEPGYGSADPGYGGSLPHWTEPPSGEVPRILPDSEPPAPADDDDLKAWSTLSSGPRWRDQDTDWDDSQLAASEMLDDPEMRLGALRTGEEEDPFAAQDPRLAPPADAARAPGVAEPRAVRPPGGARRRAAAQPRGAGEFSPGGGRSGGGGGLSDEMRGRELQVRVITGAIVLGVLLLAAAIGPGALTFIVAVALVMATAELYEAFRTHGYHPASLLGLAATAALVGVIHWRPGEMPLVLILLIVFSLLWYLVGVSRARPLPNVAVTVFGFFYVGFLGSFAAVLLELPDGVGIVLGAILATAAYDTGAYFVGSWGGKTPLMPHISPGKTVEGLVGGAFGALVMCLLIVRMIAPWDWGRAFWLALVVSVVAPLGDLCESMLKRDLGVKDMGTIVRGHGGVLDRIDALLFVMPATYYLLRVLG